ncbi:MAG TPA: hypothetical protein VG308_09175 [Stellaceae bacterium]|nr:hypothetical protein [Stellaceae bacterium]
MAIQVVGYAIVSRDGMIADASGRMTEVLIVEADQAFYHASLARARLVVHGRNSAEPGAATASRPRLIATTRVDALAPGPSPLSSLWNPNGLPFVEALLRLGIDDGIVAVVGGTDVFDLFLVLGYDSFFLSRSERGDLPGGRPVFRAVPARTPEEVLLAAGMQCLREDRLAPDLTLSCWERALPE